MRFSCHLRDRVHVPLFYQRVSGFAPIAIPLANLVKERVAILPNGDHLAFADAWKKFDQFGNRGNEAIFHRDPHSCAK